MGDQCGSCSAFASIAAVETCFKRITGRFEKYSEQQLLDCGYGWNNAKGCKGAPAHAYLDWLGNNHSSVALDKDYPYESKVASCRDTRLPKNNKNKVVPVVSSSYYVNDGTEDNLKKMVYKHGAVVASIRFTNATAEKLINYHGKNIFDGCTSADITKNENGHAMAVVGYGKQGGKSYWLIKNSWGTNWGDKGYMKLRRGVGACKIGKTFAVIECTSSDKCPQGAKTCKKEYNTAHLDD